MVQECPGVSLDCLSTVRPSYKSVPPGNYRDFASRGTRAILLDLRPVQIVTSKIALVPLLVHGYR
jgi:hypothetical protein